MMDRLLDDPEILALADEARQETEPSFWRLTTPRASVVAASLIVAAGLSFAFFTWPETVPGADVISEFSGVEPKAFATGIGEKSTIVLLDDSEVTLNADSQLEVAFDDSQRTLTLIRGQAYFKVAKDEARPFVVLVNDRRIIAIGTEFDVRFREEGRVDVTLVEGRVDIELTSGNPSKPTDAEKIEKLTLKPGEKLIDTSVSAPSIASTKVSDETSWMTGRLIFRDTPLPDAIREVNLYSSRQIALAPDARLNGMKISGVFRAGRSYTFLDALQAAHPLQASEISETEVRLEWVD